MLVIVELWKNRETEFEEVEIVKAALYYPCSKSSLAQKYSS